VPEGDTIWRTARTLQAWLAGRTITAARSTKIGDGLQRLIGATVGAVEARGKHLLLRADNGLVVHTHMRMTGSWHVYGAADRWRRPASQAVLVLEAGDHLAVCFNAPVVELLGPRDELVHPVLRRLGPDVLVEPIDLPDISRRAATLDPATTVGELLLDQRVVSGIGNIYRSESLFVAGLHPDTAVGAIDDDTLHTLVQTAARLMRPNLGQVGRDFGGGADRPYVYDRAGRPCRRCGARIKVARHGRDARTVWWCPTCQPAPAPA
jgi:endonuclease VIII